MASAMFQLLHECSNCPQHSTSITVALGTCNTASNVSWPAPPMIIRGDASWWWVSGNQHNGLSTRSSSNSSYVTFIVETPEVSGTAYRCDACTLLIHPVGYGLEYFAVLLLFVLSGGPTAPGAGGYERDRSDWDRRDLDDGPGGRTNLARNASLGEG